MSIQFSDPDLEPTYQGILTGSADYDWALFNQSGNELKVQATGNGLEELEEEFMDGRIQYAFARVKDANSSLDKFVTIAWCGEGVPESRKGLFHTQSSQVSTKFLRGSHIIIQARSDLDVTPKHIHKRIQESSGSKYSSSAAAPTPAPAAAPKAAPSYRPSQGLGGSQGKPAAVSTPASTFSRPTPAPAAAPKPAPAPAAPAAPAPPPREPSPPPPAPAPAAPAAPPAMPSRPAVASANTPAPNEPPKPKEEDRIAPVGTAYTPIKLQPGKLANRWNPSAGTGGDDAAEDSGAAPSIKDRMAAFGGSGGTQPAVPAGVGLPSSSGKKLTWSERQAQAKKEREEEEQRSADASKAAGVGAGAGAVGGALAGMGIASGAAKFGGAGKIHAPSGPPANPAAAAAPPPMPSRPSGVPPRAASPGSDKDAEGEDDDDWGAPPAPKANAPFRPETVEDEDGEEVAAPPPPPPPAAPPAQAADPQVEELQRLKQDLTLSEAPPAGGPPPIPNATRPGAGGAAAGGAAAGMAAAGAAIAASRGGATATSGAPPATAGKRARALYEYEAAEDNEISFAEEEIITQIEEIDDGWWSGTNAAGQSGLFPSNYCELIDDGTAEPAEEEEPEAPTAPPAPPVAPGAAAAAREVEEEEAQAEGDGEYMIAAYDYDAAEENELSFKEGDKITNIDKVDADWWQGSANGQSGLFPSAYVVAPGDYAPE